MPELLIVIAAWLAANSDLPPTEMPPRIAFVQPAEMAGLRRDRAAAPPEGLAVTGTIDAPWDDTAHEVHAFYDDRSRTIHLPKGWSAGSPADVSLLVHELAHHLQNVAGLDYPCPEAREQPAYQAQARWLELFGTSLSSAFAVDAMTLHLRTHCLY